MSHELKNIYAVVFTCIFASSALADPSESDMDYVGFGMGVIQCPEVTENFEKEKFQFVLKTWLGGYMTGINSVLKEHSVGLSKPDLEGAVTAIKAYCEVPGNQNDYLAQSAEEYWRERIRQITASTSQ